MDSNDEFDFPAEEEAVLVPDSAKLPWKVLVVDDDEQIHAVTRLALRKFTFRGRRLELLNALSGAAARTILEQHKDIALALVDVVMEHEYSGLELVRAIRDDMGNRAIRLIMRTGQPGHAPEHSVIVDYEVDDYKSKTELTSEKLFAIVVSSLRSYEYIKALQALTEDLEARVAMRTAELERIALIDPLTGAGNRRHLQVRAEAEIANTKRDGRPLSVLTFDIDFFKRINDTHGHAAGDQVLKRVVTLAKATLRPDDFLARVGGEEFVVLLPHCPVDAAMRTAERIRACFVNTPIALEKSNLNVTASFGVSQYAAGAPSLEAVLERADGALYEAKHNGRNQVALAEI